MFFKCLETLLKCKQNRESFLKKKNYARLGKMSFISKIEVETNMEETDSSMMEPPLSPVFPSESNGKKKHEETNKMSPAGENSKKLIF